MVKQETATEQAKVVFLSRESANTTFIVDRETRDRGRSAEGIPVTELTRDDRKAVFRAGICQTSDPKVIAFLDAREDCWRANDKLANLKMQYGGDQVSEIAEAVAAELEPAPVAADEVESE